jgi:hypothetical protein
LLLDEPWQWKYHRPGHSDGAYSYKFRTHAVFLDTSYRVYLGNPNLDKRQKNYCILHIDLHSLQICFPE